MTHTLDGSFIYISREAAENVAPGSMTLSDGTELTGLEVEINKFYNFIGRDFNDTGANTETGITFLSVSDRYKTLESRTNRTKIVSGDATYFLSLGRVTISKLVSETMLEEQEQHPLVQHYGAPLDQIVLGDKYCGVDRRQDYAARAAFQSNPK